jgi:hypothetical protein
MHSVIDLANYCLNQFGFEIRTLANIKYTTAEIAQSV